MVARQPVNGDSERRPEQTAASTCRDPEPSRPPVWSALSPTSPRPPAPAVSPTPSCSSDRAAQASPSPASCPYPEKGRPRAGPTADSLPEPCRWVSKCLLGKSPVPGSVGRVAEMPPSPHLVRGDLHTLSGSRGSGLWGCQPVESILYTSGSFMHFFSVSCLR